MGAQILTGPTVTPAVETPDQDGYSSGWFCVATGPFQCPAPGCAFVAGYLTAAHLIVVWPAVDDMALLNCARDARDLGRNPRVVEYEPGFGEAIAYDAWVAAGRPIHGRMNEPEGYDDRGRL